MALIQKHVLGFFLIALALALSPMCSTVGFAQAASDDDEQPAATSTGWPYQTHGSIGLTALFVDVNGSESKYRSDYNYRSGFALESFSLDLDGSGQTTRLMDHLKLDGAGFGGAYPYEQARLSFGKEGAYEFRGRYWKQNYFQDLASFALNSHGKDNARRTMDLNLVLFPGNTWSVELNYFRNHKFGTSFTSSEHFNNLYQLIDPRRATTQDFRIGVHYDQGPTRVSVFQNFRFFKDDPNRTENRLLDTGTLPQAEVSAPVRQKVPSTNVTARYAPSDQWSLEGRYTYSDGHVESGLSSFVALEIIEGISLEEIARHMTTSDRPEHLAAGIATFSIGPNLVFRNELDYHTFDITGDLTGEVTFQSTVPGSGSTTTPVEDSTFFDYRLFKNESQLEFFLSTELSVYGGYRFSNRDLARDSLDPGDSTSTHTGLAGAAWRPYRGARLSLEFETGSADNAFTSVEPRGLTRWRFSANLPVVPGLSISPHFLISDTENKTEDNSFNADQRQIGVEALYTVPGSQVLVSGGYALLVLESAADIFFFLDNVPVEGVSNYSTKLHFVHSLVEVPVRQWVSLRFGYDMLRDPASSSFPLKRHQGMAGLQFRTGERLTWDVFWRHVSYNEDLFDQQDYMANRLGIRLGWSF
jgi:hypothetical protein